MMTIRRCAGMAALTVVAAVALIAAGCGGGGDGGPAVQTGTVSGTVNYAATGDALGGIEVTIGNMTVTTNNNGQFTINGVPVGQQTMQIQAGAQRDLILPPGVPLNVNVNAGQTTQVGTILMVDDVDTPPSPPS